MISAFSGSGVAVVESSEAVDARNSVSKRERAGSSVRDLPSEGLKAALKRFNDSNPRTACWRGTSASGRCSEALKTSNERSPVYPVARTARAYWVTGR